MGEWGKKSTIRLAELILVSKMHQGIAISRSLSHSSYLNSLSLIGVDGIWI